MSGHEHFEEDLTLYALGSLPGDDRATLERHLQGCSGCQGELERLRGDMALLALSAVGPAPPRRARERLLAAMGREPRLRLVPSRRSWWMPAGWVAAAAVAAVAAILWNNNSALRQDLSVLRAQNSQQLLELENARRIVSTITEPTSQRFTLVAANSRPQPQGKAIYVRERSSLVFLANNMPPPPLHKAYELWLIPSSGAPIPAGVFKPDAHGSATLINPPIPAGISAKAFAITVEPEQGSSTPTMPIVLVGAGE
jgi:anti-sigma-K factor RskA